MSQWLSHLTAFSAAAATGQAHRFEQAIKAAYEAGAPREEFFPAADSARLLTQIPAPILEKAHAAIHAWYWMESRRVWERRAPAFQAAQAAALGSYGASLECSGPAPASATGGPMLCLDGMALAAVVSRDGRRPRWGPILRW